MDAVSGVETSPESARFRFEFVIEALLEEAGRFDVRIEPGVRTRGGSVGSGGSGVRVRPVRREEIFRSVEERQRTVRETFAGRECQVSITVPTISTMRRVVIMCVG